MPTEAPAKKAQIYVSGVRQISTTLHFPDEKLALVLEHLEKLKGPSGMIRSYSILGKIVNGSSTCEVTFSESQEGAFYELLQNWEKGQGLEYEGITAGDVYATDAILQNHQSLMDNLKLWKRFGYCPK
jgi:hypothetical protein